MYIADYDGLIVMGNDNYVRILFTVSRETLAVENFGELSDKMHLAEYTLANLWFLWIENISITVFIVDSVILIIILVHELRKVASIMSSHKTFSTDSMIQGYCV